MKGPRKLKCFHVTLTGGAISISCCFCLFVLQEQRSAEMQEMHQRTREAVDSIVQHYQVVACIVSTRAVLMGVIVVLIVVIVIITFC